MARVQRSNQEVKNGKNPAVLKREKASGRRAYTEVLRWAHTGRRHGEEQGIQKRVARQSHGARAAASYKFALFQVQWKGRQ